MNRQVTRRCLSLIRTLDISESLDFTEFCNRLERRRGRAIQLIPITVPQALCGMWIKAPTIDYIFYMRSASPLHQKHIVLHEFGHMLFEHEDAPLLETSVAAQLMPDLSPQLVDKMLHRSAFNSDSVAEREAEAFADLTALRLNRSNRASESTQDVRPEVRNIIARIERALSNSKT